MKESLHYKENMNKYLAQWEQSQLSETDNDFIESTIHFDSNNPCDSIYKWKEEMFFLRNKSMQAYIGENTMSKIIENKVLQWCHDDALVVATVLRKYGIPCTMLETVNIEHVQWNQWWYKWHVFLKVFLQGERKIYDASHNEFVTQDTRWIIKSPKLKSHLYPIAEGQDTRSYGVFNHKDLYDKIDAKKYTIEKIRIKKRISEKIIDIFKKN